MLVLYVVTPWSAAGSSTPTPLQSAIGFVTAFFDTLGIGSFATTTAVYKLRDLVPVKLIPGTLNVGHAPGDDRAGVHLHAARAGRRDDAGADDRGGVAGAWLGAGVVVHWPRRKIQIGMGVALLGAAALMLMTSAQPVSRRRRYARPHRRAARHRAGAAISCSAR